MTTKTTTRKRAGVVPSALRSVSETELRELIRQELDARRKNRLFYRRILPFFQRLRDSKVAWFLFGILFGALFSLPLLSISTENENLFRWRERTAIIKPISTDSPQTLAKNAPYESDGDQLKRKTLAEACELIARQIESQVITSQDEALSALSNETANILSSAAWKKTSESLDRMLGEKKTLAEFAVLLEEISAAFQNSKTN